MILTRVVDVLDHKVKHEIQSILFPSSHKYHPVLNLERWGGRLRDSGLGFLKGQVYEVFLGL